MKLILERQDIEQIAVAHINEKFAKSGLSTDWGSTNVCVVNGIATVEATLTKPPRKARKHR